MHFQINLALHTVGLRAVLAVALVRWCESERAESNVLLGKTRFLSKRNDPLRRLRRSVDVYKRQVNSSPFRIGLRLK